LGDEGGYQISRSVRLRSSASGNLSRTPSSATNRKTWTWSAWVKRGTLGASSGLFQASPVVSNQTSFTISSSNTIFLQDYSAASSYNLVWESSAVFRDPSAWYHIVVVFDSTQASSANAVKLYVNGVQQTLVFTAYTGAYVQNRDGYINSNIAHNIGLYSLSDYFDGYLTEINFIDGQALTPSSFGETDSITGVWKPKSYSGTYGTNGFELNFSDNSTAAALGTDFSGNSNTWTVNNISVTAGTTYDSMTDVPTLTSATTANYCVFNPLAVTPVAATFAEANLKVTTGAAGGNAFGTFAIPSSGKWYWEITAGSGTSPYIGISAYLATQTYAWQNTNSVFYSGSNGDKSVDSSASAYGSTYTTNDVIGVAVDVDASTITFYKNNVSQGAISHTFVNVFPCLADGASATTDTFYANFGQRPFSYTPPSGFVALNTYNLPTPTISNGANYMAATLWTGNGTSQTISNAVNGVSFQPDWVWMKARSTTYQHSVYDAVRTTSAGRLATDQTLAEIDNGANNPSFTSSGITVRAVLNDNGSSQTFVGWQWNAGGSTVTNTSGSISSQVRANTTAGFSVVTYTGTGANATVGHGLGVAPKMVIVKNRASAFDWVVWHTAFVGSDYLILNATSAVATAATLWNSTTPTSSVFSVGTSTATNASGSSHVAYCFSAVAGYSAFGSYTGNGSNDGVFIYTGFRPRWFMVKRTDGVGSWVLVDTSRSPTNVTDQQLYPNLANAESGDPPQGTWDMLSNGVKMRYLATNYNASGSTYIYAAFAENPFKLSLAR
jgi:hypothetical protein